MAAPVTDGNAVRVTSSSGVTQRPCSTTTTGRAAPVVTDGRTTRYRRARPPTVRSTLVFTQLPAGAAVVVGVVAGGAVDDVVVGASTVRGVVRATGAALGWVAAPAPARAATEAMATPTPTAMKVHPRSPAVRGWRRLMSMHHPRIAVVLELD